MAAWQQREHDHPLLGTNGLLREYLPKGTNLAVHSQGELNAITLNLNTRPRRRLDWCTPLQVYNELIDLDQAPLGTMQ